MTVIALDTDKNSLVLGSDSQWSDGEGLVSYETKIVKIEKGGKILGAIASSGDAKPGLELESAVVQLLTKSHLRKDSVLKKLRILCSDIDKNAQALVVFNGRGYHIDTDGLVMPVARYAIGSGAHVALGAMWGWRHMRENPIAYGSVNVGIQAAISLVESCGGTPCFFEQRVFTNDDEA